jgi:hypothetical protein
MITLYSKIEKDMVDCPMEVVIWNYWDREHLTGTHYLHYRNVQVVAEKENWCLTKLYLTHPVIPLKLVSHVFSYMENPGHMRSIHLGKIMHLEQDFYFSKTGPESCKVTLEQSLRLPLSKLFKKPLEPIWKKLTLKWFIPVWDEDSRMRLRRWKVWQLGFKDFSGIDYINQKRPKPEERESTLRHHPVELPIKISTPISTEGWPRLFKNSVEIGYGNSAD